MPPLHLLLLVPLLGCATSQEWTVVRLANGGTSRPLQVWPLNPGPSHAPKAKALAQATPTPGTPVGTKGSVEGLWESLYGGLKIGVGEVVPQVAEVTMLDSNVEERGRVVKKVSTRETTGREVEVVDGEGAKDPQPYSMTATTTTSTTTTTTTTTTTKAPPPITSPTPQPTTPPTDPPSPTLQPTTLPRPTPQPTAPSTSMPLPTVLPTQPCHQSCLEALNATQLSPNTTNLALRVGSSLTLECHMPLVPELVLEDLIWLFHPGGSPEGQCSLTQHKFIHSCPGFPTIAETDDRNDTFLRQTLALSGLHANHTGEYMCQVQVTCCPGSQEHVMTQERQARVRVTVWWADYTVDLAAAGVMAGVLLLILAGVSFYQMRREGCGGGSYLPVEEAVKGEVEAPAVLHLPLLDDQDTDDSFNSSDGDEPE